MDAQIDHDGKDTGYDAKAWTASVGYEYGLSERTTLYCGAGYRDRKVDGCPLRRELQAPAEELRRGRRSRPQLLIASARCLT